jgi:hypothetical protein
VAELGSAPSTTRLVIFARIDTPNKAQCRHHVGTRNRNLVGVCRSVAAQKPEISGILVPT